LVCRDDKGVVAAVGLEIFGRRALLRSLVVDREMRGQGLGGTLTAAAEALASRSEIESIYLLTTSAEDFFRTRGYRIIARSEAPAEIQRTTQFSELCPSTAVLMVKP
jgi:amino-acid N-acetyltransferase